MTHKNNTKLFHVNLTVGDLEFTTPCIANSKADCILQTCCTYPEATIGYVMDEENIFALDHVAFNTSTQEITP